MRKLAGHVYDLLTYYKREKVYHYKIPYVICLTGSYPSAIHSPHLYSELHHRNG